MTAKRFLFVSMGSWGHMDFGGGSFLRTATELLRHGHEVWWTTATQRKPEAIEHLKATPIRWADLNGGLLDLYLQPPLSAALHSVRCVVDFIRREKVDVLVSEQLCRLAAVAAHAAGIPWAAVGTDGRPWQLTLNASGSGHLAEQRAVADTVSPLCEALGLRGFPETCLHSDWLVSPYLNLSFLPRALFEDESDDAPPRQSHFVGCSAREAPSGEGRRRIVVSFGNTMDPPARQPLIRALAALSRSSLVKDHPIVVLAGSANLASRLGSECLVGEHFVVEQWVDYRIAFADARLAIGHGGCAIAWEAIRNGIPLLSVAPGMGEQAYLSRQLRRLGAGAIVEQDRIAADLGDAIHALLDDDRFSLAMGGLARRLFAGGGVDASRALLETLAATRAPILACAIPACCSD
jgi:hypothetical protein